MACSKVEGEMQCLYSTQLQVKCLSNNNKNLHILLLNPAKLSASTGRA